MAVGMGKRGGQLDAHGAYRFDPVGLVERLALAGRLGVVERGPLVEAVDRFQHQAAGPRSPVDHLQLGEHRLQVCAGHKLHA